MHSARDMETAAPTEELVPFEVTFVPTRREYWRSVTAGIPGSGFLIEAAQSVGIGAERLGHTTLLGSPRPQTHDGRAPPRARSVFRAALTPCSAF